MRGFKTLLALVGVCALGSPNILSAAEYNCAAPPDGMNRFGYRLSISGGPTRCFKTLDAVERALRTDGVSGARAARLAFPTADQNQIALGTSSGTYGEWALDYRPGAALTPNGADQRPPETFTGPFFTLRAGNWPPMDGSCSNACGNEWWEGWCKGTSQSAAIAPAVCAINATWGSGWLNYRWQVSAASATGGGSAFAGVPTMLSQTYPSIDPSGQGRVGATYYFGATGPRDLTTTGAVGSFTLSRLGKSASALVIAAKDAQTVQWPVEKREPWFCPLGYSVNGTYPNPCGALDKVLIQANSPPTFSECKFGNPCAPGSGNKQIRETDFTYAGIRFERVYNSNRHLRYHSFLGENWSHSFSNRVQTSYLHPAHPLPVSAVDELGEVEVFEQVAIGTSGITDPTVVAVYAGRISNGKLLLALQNGEWRLLRNDGRIERYDQYGRLTQRVEPDRPERTITVSYSTTILNPVDWRFWRVEAVRDPQGRGLNFTYSSDHDFRLDRVHNEDNSLQLVRYTHDGTQSYRPRLQSAQRIDGTWRQYTYDLTSATSPLPYHITSIIDELGRFYANYEYDDWGRVTASWHGSQLNAGRISITYSQENTAIVTDALGKVSTIAFDPTRPYRRIGATIAPDGTTSQTYYEDGRLQSKTDASGLISTYFYDSLGRQRRVVESRGSVNLRAIERTWDPNHSNRVKSIKAFRFDAAVEVEEQRTEFLYNSQGQITSRTISAIQNGLPVRTRTWSYAYCSSSDIAGGFCAPASADELPRLRSIDGPRTDISDIERYTYYPVADTSGCSTTSGSCYRAGDLKDSINALGQVTRIERYDRQGRVTRVVDANGVASEYAYDDRGRLTSRVTRGASVSSDSISAMSYDNVGNLVSVTDPDGAVTRFIYDAANRLVRVCDNTGNAICTTGNRLIFVLDAQGNRLREETLDSSGTLRRVVARQFNALGQMRAQINAPYALEPDLDNSAVLKTRYTYDSVGRLDLLTDPNGVVTDSDHDDLGRIWRTIADKGVGATDINSMTQFSYDVRDNLRTVRDPKGLDTTYVYDGLDNLVSQLSPDTGATTYLHDDAGNTTQKTDSRGVVSAMAYDALNRLRSVSYPSDTALNLAFHYDEPDSVTGCVGSHPVGRLTRFVDVTGSTTYCYDRRGNITRKRQVTFGSVIETEYSYTLGDRLATLTYPGGGRVRYTYDVVGRASSMFWRPAGSTVESTLISSVQHNPYGPIAQIVFGGTRLLMREYDQNYWPTSIQGGPSSPTVQQGLSIAFGYSPTGNVSSISANGVVRDVQHDDLSRLTHWRNLPALPGTPPLESYTYDATSNRLSSTRGLGPTVTYGYPSGSHRLQAVGAAMREYDDAGNTTEPIGAGYMGRYDARNRLSDVAVPCATKACSTNGWRNQSNYFNARGERVGRGIADRFGFIGGLRRTPADLLFSYDESGRLLGEYSTTGQPSKLYIWLGDTPVGVVIGTSLHYVEADHLGTPRVIVDPSRNVPVWRWDLYGSAFGDHFPIIDPDGDDVAVTYHLRYPGQYYDAETGLHYNYFRDYEPGIGRYVQSDPIGLRGGIATYPYVNGNPLSFKDPDGTTSTLNELCAGFRLLVLTFCKGNSSCERTDECPELMEKIGKKENCLIAQTLLTNVCFPDNPTHKQRITDEINGIKRCIKILGEKGCLTCQPQ